MKPTVPTPVKIVTFTNSALGMVQLEMLVDGLPDYQTDNGSFDYAAIAAAVGIRSVRVEQPARARSCSTAGSARRSSRPELRNIARPAIPR